MIGLRWVNIQALDLDVQSSAVAASFKMIDQEQLLNRKYGSSMNENIESCCIYPKAITNTGY
jgi:hypothetical protein